MDRLLVKHTLLDRGMTLATLASEAGIAYDRAVKIVNGYRQPRSPEILAISRILKIPARALLRRESTAARTTGNTEGS